MLDRYFQEKQNKQKNIKAPKNMEMSLKSALDNVGDERKVNKIKVASLIFLCTLLLSYKSISIAGYIKEFTYPIKFKTLDQEKNNIYKFIKEGYGQNIERVINIKNEDKMILSRLLLTENRTYLYGNINFDKYSIIIKDGNKKIEAIKSIGGDGESLLIFNKKIKDSKVKLIIIDNKTREEYSSIISINKDQALSYNKKVFINKSYPYKDLKINVNSIDITPTSIIVEGYSEHLWDLIIRSINSSYKNNRDIDINFIINGKEYPWNSKELTTNLLGRRFEFELEEFPKNINNIKLKLIEDHKSRIIEIK